MYELLLRDSMFVCMYLRISSDISFFSASALYWHVAKHIPAHSKTCTFRMNKRISAQITIELQTETEEVTKFVLCILPNVHWQSVYTPFECYDALLLLPDKRHKFNINPRKDEIVKQMLEKETAFSTVASSDLSYSVFQFRCCHFKEQKKKSWQIFFETIKFVQQNQLHEMGTTYWAMIWWLIRFA